MTYSEDSNTNQTLNRRKFLKFAGLSGIGPNFMSDKTGGGQNYLSKINTQTSFQASNDRTQEEIEGDLLIEKGDTVEFSDKEIILKGNLILNPRATLILRNCLLSIVHEFKAHRRIWAREDTTIQVIDSTIRPIDSPNQNIPGQEWLHTNLRIAGADRFEVENSEVIGRLSNDSSTSGETPKTIVKNSTISYLRWTTDNDHEISGSKLGWVILGFGGGNRERLTIEGFRKGQTIDGFDLQTNDGGKLHLDNTYIEQQLNSDFWSKPRPQTEKEVIFKNCDLARVMTKTPPTENTIQITNLPKEGQIDEFDLSEHIEGHELSYNYIIKDSWGAGVKIELMGTKANIKNSQLMLHSNGPAEAEVYNSEIANRFNYGADRIEFYNVDFKGSFKFLNSHGPFERNEYSFKSHFENCQADLDFLVVGTDNDGVLTGELDFQNLSLDELDWERGEITREYPVTVRENGGPIQGMEVILEDKQGKTIATETTNSEGKASFRLDFDSEKSKDQWRIIAPSIGTSETVSFISDTPIVLSPPQPSKTPTAPAERVSGRETVTNTPTSNEVITTFESETQAPTEANSPGFGLITGLTGIGGLMVYRWFKKEKDRESRRDS